MFSSQRKLTKRTPAGGIDRREYIGHLVDEYYTSTNVEALEQVSANLANFAYDPINWPYLHEAEALDLFITSLDSQNEKLQLHGIGALCNFCLDINAAKFIIENIAKVRNLFLRTERSEIVLHSLALHYQILTAQLANKEQLITPTLLQRVHHWRVESKDERVVKLCQVFLEDCGSRIEVKELQNAPTATTSTVQPSTSQTAGSSISETIHTTRS